MDLRDQLQATLGDTYRLERELGGGGMSRVFVAEERALGRKVVVKVLPLEASGHVSIERFKREISVAARLQHPHIVPLLTAGDADGTPFFTMPYISGESLRVRLVNHGELPINEAVRILREVASALAFAHAAGVEHRDIKPDNVLIAGGAAMVTDFGVAKALSASSGGGSAVTSLGIALGTPAYMSPEQASADPLVDHRSDIYSWGVLAYELLTGQTPFGGRPAHAMLAAHAREDADDISRRRPGIPAALAQLVRRCLSKRAADRPQTADELVRGLDDIVTPSGGMSPTQLTRQPLRRRSVAPLLVAGAAVIIIAVAGLTYVTTRSGSPSSRSDVAAPREKRLAVMPFENVGNDTAVDWFADGITDELTAALGKVPGLRLAQRQQVYVYHDSVVDPKVVGRTLGVDALVTGAVRRSGTRMRVTVQLVNASDGLSTWSDVHERDVKDVFAAEDAMARSIVAQLQLVLGSGQQLVASATKSVEAHDLVLRAQYLSSKYTESALRRSIALFDSAFRIDPKYAAAAAGAAISWITLADDWIAPAEALPHAKKAIRSAAAIDSLSPDLWYSQAYIAIYERDLREAARLWGRAFRSRPDLLSAPGNDAYFPYPIVLYSLGRREEADGAISDYVSYNRTSQPALSFAATYYRTIGDTTRALGFCERAIESRASLRQTDTCDAFRLTTAGRLEEALATARGLDLEQRRGRSLGFYGLPSMASEINLLVRLGRTAEARQIADSVSSEYTRHYVREDILASAYANLGDAGETVRWLERGLRSNSWGVALIFYQYATLAVRKDPRIIAFARRAGLPDPPSDWVR
jgi:serine/threonine protein kinase